METSKSTSKVLYAFDAAGPQRRATKPPLVATFFINRLTGIFFHVLEFHRGDVPWFPPCHVNEDRARNDVQQQTELRGPGGIQVQDSYRRSR